MILFSGVSCILPHNLNAADSAPVRSITDHDGDGHSLALALPRVWVGDMLDCAKDVPGIPVERVFQIGSLLQLRKASRVRWVSLFLKAYAIVCREMPQLRRSYLMYPYRRLWQHERNVASVAIGREYQGEQAVFFARIRNPESLPLSQVDDTITYYQSTPIEKVGSFQRQIRLAKWPRFCRMLMWKFGLKWNGVRRERYFGTFGLSVYSSNGANSLHPISPLTTLLNYGPIDDTGKVSVRIVYDHRVLDGGTIGNALARLEQVLLNDIANELKHILNSSISVNKAA